MNKFGFVIGLIIAIGTMLVIPSPIGHMAKASTCSSQFGTHHGSLSTSVTTSGGCSTGSAAASSGAASVIAIHGGLQSSCQSVSVSHPTHEGTTPQDSNGAVSCSSHSP